MKRRSTANSVITSLKACNIDVLCLFVELEHDAARGRGIVHDLCQKQASFLAVSVSGMLVHQPWRERVYNVVHPGKY